MLVGARVRAVTDEAITQPTPLQEAEPWGFTALVTLVVHRVRGLFLSQTEREIRSLVLSMCERFGQPLLQSEGLFHLDDLIDAALYSRELHATNVRLNRIVWSAPKLLARLSEDSAAAGFGVSFAEKELPAVQAVAEGDRWEREVTAALRRFIVGFNLAEDSASVGKAIDEVDSGGPLGFLHDSSVAPEAARGLVGFHRATICTLGLGAMLMSPERPAPWLVQAIAERRRDGYREHLRGLASNPAFDVPLEVVPAEERFDWFAAHAQHARGVQRLADLLVEETLPIPSDLD